MIQAGEHRSIWQATVPGRSFGQLGTDTHADVVVVGAGITGLTAAVLLARKGKRVVVIERDHVASGTTGTTSAHLTTMSDLTYREIVRRYGKEKAREVSVSMNQAIDTIEDLVTTCKIRCGFSRTNGYYYSEDSTGDESVLRELEAAHNAGQLVEMVDTIPLPFAVSRGFVVKNQALIHPTAYCNGLAETALGSGAEIFTGTEVVDFKDGEPCEVQTTRGVIRAHDLFLATHTPLGVNPLQGAMSIERSYAIAVTLTSRNVPGLFWNTADPYEYIRPYITPDGVETLIVGGKDHETGHGNPQHSLEELIRYTTERFSVDRVLFNWSSQHYDPSDSLPYIGRSPFSKHIWIGTGFSGDGLVLGTLAGMVISDLLVKHESRFSELYQPSRLSLKSIPEFIQLNIQNARVFLGDRLKAGKEPEKLLPGEGTVREHISPVAIYKDDKGDMHKCGAVCTHLQCVVHWNSMEQSWDCPCHGSRFGAEGQIIEGPALKGLEKKE